jgi:hypothetical protein
MDSVEVKQTLLCKHTYKSSERCHRYTMNQDGYCSLHNSKHYKQIATANKRWRHKKLVKIEQVCM